jgi:hypothetical protein
VAEVQHRGSIRHPRADERVQPYALLDIGISSPGQSKIHGRRRDRHDLMVRSRPADWPSAQYWSAGATSGAQSGST